MRRKDRITQEEQIFLHLRNSNSSKIENYLERGECVNKTRWSGWSLLHRAAETGQTETCQLLLINGANINSRTALGWYTPLHVCLANG